MVDTSSPPTAERMTSQTLKDAEEGSPILTMIAKRLRAAKKRLGKIESLECKPRDTLNKDQEETLSGKAKTLATIEELERLVPLLEVAKEEEIRIAVTKAVDKALSDERSRVAAEAAEAKPEPEASTQTVETTQQDQQETVERLIKLLYFSQTFDTWRMNGPLAKLERGACLSHYQYQAPPESEALSEDDLQLVVKLGGLMLSRRTHEPVSHAEGLQEATALALQWLSPSAEPVAALDGKTVDHVSSILQRIMSTSYMTVRPVLDAGTAEEVTPLPQAGNDYEKPSYGHSQQAQHAPFQGRPETPELHPQGSTNNLLTDPSPNSQPPSQESSFSHYTDSASLHDANNYFQANGYPRQANPTYGYQHDPQEYASQHMGHQMSQQLSQQQHVPNGSFPHQRPASQPLPAGQFQPDRGTEFTQDGGISSQGAPPQREAFPPPPQHDQYTNGQADVSNSSYGPSGQDLSGLTEHVNAVTDVPSGAVRQRGEGGRPPYRSGYRNNPRGGRTGGPSQGGGYSGRDRGGRHNRGRGRGRTDGLQGHLEGGPGRGYRGKGVPDKSEQSHQ